MARSTRIAINSQSDQEAESTNPSPPIAFRDTASFTLAGEVLPTDDTKSSSSSSSSSSLSPLRQSPSSSNPLLSPPRPIPTPYAWLRDDTRTNPSVLSHLHAENTYGQQLTSHLDSLRRDLYDELKTNMMETEYTTPVPKGRFWYYLRMQEGVSYPVYCRAPREDEGELFHPPINPDWDSSNVAAVDGGGGGDDVARDKTTTTTTTATTSSSSSLTPLLPGEQIYLDVPQISQNKPYLSVGVISISPNQDYVAYTLDETGGETCQLYVRHIDSGEEWMIYDVGNINISSINGGSSSAPTTKNNDKHNNENEEENESNPQNEATTTTTMPLLECDGSVTWNDQNTALFYVTMDEAHRPHRVYRRQIFNPMDGSYIPPEEQHDELLLEEKDELFNVGITKTFDGKYFIVRCSSKEASEVHYIKLRKDDSDNDDDEEELVENNLTCLAKRRAKVLYRVTHCQGYWLIQTNYGGMPNLRLMACRVGDEGNGENWVDVVMSGQEGSKNLPAFDGGDTRSLDGVTVFVPGGDGKGDEDTPNPHAYVVASGREDGLPRVWVLELQEEDAGIANASPLTVSKMTRLEFDEAACDVGLGPNRDHTLPYVVVGYDSLVTPPSNIAIPLSNPVDLDVRRVLKQKEVPGYDKELYACERTFVKSRDGKTDIPVSLVYHRDVLNKRANGDTIPTHMYGYGSYGASIEASFRATRLPLLNRGMVYVIAHVRGGGENGRPWYEEPMGAKYLCKMNTFNDFVDVARWLTGEEVGATETSDDFANLAAPSIGKGFTHPATLSCEGRSAGGLLVGASLNQAPELFRAAILGVPFVDVVCTMIDATIPLTVAEWEEWGNPNEEKYFDYMMSYCPMNNVKYGAVYPACLLTGGLYDPRVQYWEPAKFAAELRHGASNESGSVVLKIDMEAGHFSASDRYKYLKELAFDYAFLLDQLGLVE